MPTYLIIYIFFHLPGGAFEGVEDQISPFGYGRGEGVDAGSGDPEWICSKEKPSYDIIFKSLNPIDGKVTGAGKETLLNTQFLTKIFYLYPELRNILTLNRTLDTISSINLNINNMSQLCLALKDSEIDKVVIDKLIEAIRVLTENSAVLSQSFSSERDLLSIKSVNDDCQSVSDVSSNDNVILDSNNDISNDNLNNIGDEYSMGDKLVSTIKDSRIVKQIVVIFKFIELVILVVINAFAIVILCELLFAGITYVFTNKTYIEFDVQKPLENWVDHAKYLTIGSDIETVRIDRLTDIFREKNYQKVFRYIYSFIDSQPVVSRK